MKPLLIIRNVLGTAALVFVGYLFVKAVPDLGRYIRISRM